MTSPLLQPIETPTTRLLDVESRVLQIESLLRAKLSFGSPNSIDESGTAVGAFVDNMRGNWVEVAATSLDTNITVTHNLSVQAPTSSFLNVRWLVFGHQHSGVGVTDGTATISVLYEDGTVTADSIQLRWYADGGRTVDVSNPITTSFFFIPADG